MKDASPEESKEILDSLSRLSDEELTIVRKHLISTENKQKKALSQ